MPHVCRLTGDTLTLDDVVAVARHNQPIEIDPDAARRADRSRAVVEGVVRSGQAVYGVNTGFGRLASVRVPGDDLRALQVNLLRSHASGIGDPLPDETVRAMMVLRANVLLRETSGARPIIAQRLTELLNAGIHPVVPEQGSVGASGDLAPLSHVGLALIGEGDVTVKGERRGAEDALRIAGIAPLAFEAKEGLAFINGTQAQSAVLALTVSDARSLWRSALGAAAMSLEALMGTPAPFDERIHRARPHPGQQRAAEILRVLLADSEIRESHRVDDARVQDAYSLRCAPQILGAVADAIEFAAATAQVELNASTDNPLVLDGEMLSGGNFHGQPVALALDVLAIALTTLAGVAERRIDRLMNPETSEGLPAFLTERAGLHSGMMMVQIAAASVVAECRALSVPASVQSIPTGANQEDFVPMSMAAGFKTQRILRNAQRVVACELLSAAQGLEFRQPLRPGRGVAQLYRRVRELSPPLLDDRPLGEEIERLAALVAREALV